MHRPIAVDIAGGGWGGGEVMVINKICMVSNIYNA